MSTIAVDFDGVIHTYGQGWHDGTIYDEPMPGAFNTLAQLREKHAVFVHTTRSERQVADWLRSHDVAAVTDEEAGHPEFWNDRDRLLVANRKLPALVYLDDRAVRFINWEQAFAELKQWWI